MRVQSFMRQGLELSPVEVEVVLAPGLPRIQVIGLPDTAIKESALRIRTAIRKQGFQLPKGRQILVHLRPNHLRKSSRGLDLAIAAALLWETGQAPVPRDHKQLFLYGELSLTGEVETPDDFAEIPFIESAVLYSGPKREAGTLPCFRLHRLRDLLGPMVLAEAAFEWHVMRPSTPVTSYPEPAALLAQVMAAGEHSSLIAGPPGSGKSTLATSVHSWLEEPRAEGRAAAIRWAQFTSKPPWRPLIRPHHAITKSAMIGGGGSALAGEISRAHTGILLMDELLEFDPAIQEALREPVESGTIAVARAGHSRVHPAQVILLATTNLCDCGRFVPKVRSTSECHCSQVARRRYLRRLTGPFADRFTIIAYSDDWRGCEREYPERTADEILARVTRATEFRSLKRGQMEPNGRLKLAEIERMLAPGVRGLLDISLGNASFRRREAVLRVARTLADLHEHVAIELSDLDIAIKLAWEGHKLLQDWRD